MASNGGDRTPTLEELVKSGAIQYGPMPGQSDPTGQVPVMGQGLMKMLDAAGQTIADYEQRLAQAQQTIAMQQRVINELRAATVTTGES